MLATNEIFQNLEFFYATRLDSTSREKRNLYGWRIQVRR